MNQVCTSRQRDPGQRTTKSTGSDRTEGKRITLVPVPEMRRLAYTKIRPVTVWVRTTSLQMCFSRGKVRMAERDLRQRCALGWRHSYLFATQVIKFRQDDIYFDNACLDQLAQISNVARRKIS